MAAVMPMVPSVPCPPPCFVVTCAPCPPPCCPPPLQLVKPIMPSGACVTQPMLDVAPVKPVVVCPPPPPPVWLPMCPIPCCKPECRPVLKDPCCPTACYSPAGYGKHA